MIENFTQRHGNFFMTDNHECYGWVIALGDMFWVGGDPTRVTNLLTGAKQYKMREWAQRRIDQMDHRFWREKDAQVKRIQLVVSDET